MESTARKRGGRKIASEQRRVNIEKQAGQHLVMAVLPVFLFGQFLFARSSRLRLRSLDYAVGKVDFFKPLEINK